MGHGERSGLPVQSRPVQAQNFPPPHAIGKCQNYRGLESVTVRSVQELLRLLYRKRPALLGPDKRRRRERGDAAADDPLAFGLAESPAEHCPHDPDTVGAVPLIPLCLPEFVELSDGQLRDPLASRGTTPAARSRFPRRSILQLAVSASGRSLRSRRRRVAMPPLDPSPTCKRWRRLNPR